MMYGRIFRVRQLNYNILKNTLSNEFFCSCQGACPANKICDEQIAGILSKVNKSNITKSRSYIDGLLQNHWPLLYHFNIKSYQAASGDGLLIV